MEVVGDACREADTTTQVRRCVKIPRRQFAHYEDTPWTILL